MSGSITTIFLGRFNDKVYDLSIFRSDEVIYVAPSETETSEYTFSIYVWVLFDQ